MPVTEIGDPRLQALFGSSDPRETGVRPTVRLPRRGLPPAVLAGIALVFGLVLFMILNERRLTEREPSVETAPPAVGASAWAEPPPITIPPEEPPVAEVQPALEEKPAPVAVAVPAPAPAPPAPAEIVHVPQPVAQLITPALSPQPRVSGGSPLVIDTSEAAGGDAAKGPPSVLTARDSSVSRVRASALSNRSATITQGTLIPAVLETGFDSTQPGYARAMVSRDVRSFDGSAVLIPRGSKLVGEYRSDAGQGQKRAVIVWIRLIRPDGMTIAMDSPAVDTLGRGGVKASVDTHFWARLGDALLQSTVGLGSALAQRSVTGPVVVIPGAASSAASGGQLAPIGSYVPTLKVPAGTSISIFVAHDLDFSGAGAKG